MTLLDLHDKKKKKKKQHWENGRKSISGIRKHGCKWWGGVKLMVFKKKKEAKENSPKQGQSSRLRPNHEGLKRFPPFCIEQLSQKDYLETTKWRVELPSRYKHSEMVIKCNSYYHHLKTLRAQGLEMRFFLQTRKLVLSVTRKWRSLKGLKGTKTPCRNWDSGALLVRWWEIWIPPINLL